MKNRIKQVHAFWLIAILLLCNSSLRAQHSHSVSEDVSRAVGVLKGIYDDYSPKRAFDIITEVAETDSDAYAMNVLGLLYMEGIGVEQNGEQAIYWLKKAGDKGFNEAYHNLGMIYKNGKCGKKQNFELAYEAFLKGALGGSNTCQYDTGFMLYKGLGCQQDYYKALDYFQIASGNGNPYAIYMLGLCYRNGYGTSKNEEKGLELLNKSAILGYSDAIEEVLRESPENCLTDIFVSDTLLSIIPNNMPQISVDVNDTTLLKGTYNGFVIMYDWSGQHVLGEKPVFLNIDRKGEEAFGLFILGTDSIPFSARITSDGNLEFKKTYVNLNERYTFNGKARYMFNNTEFDIWNDKIIGKISLYSLTLREPERPMYIELYRECAEIGSNIDNDRYISTTPNPFETSFDAIFQLTNKTTATVRIFDKYGMPVWQKSLGTLEAGKHRITLCPSIKSGYHILNIAAGKQVLRKIIVKKGGSR
ncbi:MAG: sel1 repeat family protein [Prevotella sp.]|nr:sel1 repeat family protein [Candidatus Prevotella equi]